MGTQAENMAACPRFAMSVLFPGTFLARCQAGAQHHVVRGGRESRSCLSVLLLPLDDAYVGSPSVQGVFVGNVILGVPHCRVCMCRVRTLCL